MDVADLSSALERLADAESRLAGIANALDNLESAVPTNTRQQTRNGIEAVGRDINALRMSIADDTDTQIVTNLDAALADSGERLTTLSGDLSTNTPQQTQNIVMQIGASHDTATTTFSDGAEMLAQDEINGLRQDVVRLEMQPLPDNVRGIVSEVDASLVALSGALPTNTPQQTQDTLTQIGEDLNMASSDLSNAGREPPITVGGNDNGPVTASSSSQRSVNFAIGQSGVQLSGAIAASTDSREATVERADDGRIHRLRITENGESILPNDLSTSENLTMQLGNLPAAIQGGKRSILQHDDDSNFALTEGFEFSGYGAWAIYNPDGMGGSFNAESFGDANTPETIGAQSGSATYTGRTAGFQVESNQAYGTISNFSATVDFDASSVTYSSSDTHKGPLGGDNVPTFTPDSNLDFNGSADITGAGFAASDGSLRGGFYGDEDSPAQEIGGEFSFGAKNYLGSFGAERNTQ